MVLKIKEFYHLTSVSISVRKHQVYIHIKFQDLLMNTTLGKSNVVSVHFNLLNINSQATLVTVLIA